MKVLFFVSAVLFVITMAEKPVNTTSADPSPASGRSHRVPAAEAGCTANCCQHTPDPHSCSIDCPVGKSAHCWCTSCLANCICK